MHATHTVRGRHRDREESLFHTCSTPAAQRSENLEFVAWVACIYMRGLHASICVGCMHLYAWVACIHTRSAAVGEPRVGCVCCMHLYAWVACICSRGPHASVVVGRMHLSSTPASQRSEHLECLALGRGRVGRRHALAQNRALRSDGRGDLGRSGEVWGGQGRSGEPCSTPCP